MRASIPKLITGLLLVLLTLAPATGVIGQGPEIDANGVVSSFDASGAIVGGKAVSCAGIGSFEPPVVDGAAVPVVCFAFTNPSSPDLLWYIVVVPYQGQIVWGLIVGTICSERWNVTGGSISAGASRITIRAVCGGAGCDSCADTLDIDVTRIAETARWAGTYIWDGSTTYLAEMQWFRCPFGSEAE